MPLSAFMAVKNSIIASTPPADAGQQATPAQPSPLPESQASDGQDSYFARLRQHLAGYRESPQQGAGGGVVRIGFVTEPGAAR